MRKKIYYYDEINDDFAVTKNIKIKPLKSNYKFETKNVIWRFFEFVLYQIIVRPIIFVIIKLVFHHRFKNKKILKTVKGKGFYIYSNHTNGIVDAFVPNILCFFERKNYIVVSPATFSIFGISWLVKMLGAIPTGGNLRQIKEMSDFVMKKVDRGNMVTIYPEAHIWPYYNKIRKFSNASFRFPAKDGLPVFTLTNCYQKRKFSKFPKIVSYLDGPFYRDETKNVKENMIYLNEKAYFAMKSRAEEFSTYSYNLYYKVDKPEDRRVEKL